MMTNIHKSPNDQKLPSPPLRNVDIMFSKLLLDVREGSIFRDDEEKIGMTVLGELSVSFVVQSVSV